MNTLGMISPKGARRTLQRLGRDMRERGHRESEVPWRVAWYLCWPELVEALGGNRARAVAFVTEGWRRR